MAKFNGTVDNIEDNRNKVTTLDETSDNEHYPSAKAVVDYVEEHGGGGGGTDLTDYVKRDGSRSMTGDLNMNYHAINACSAMIITDQPSGLNDNLVGNIQYNDTRYLQANAKVTSITASSTDNQIPSAKAVYSAIQEALYVDTDTVIIPAEV